MLLQQDKLDINFSLSVFTLDVLHENILNMKYI